MSLACEETPAHHAQTSPCQSRHLCFFRVSRSLLLPYSTVSPLFLRPFCFYASSHFFFARPGVFYFFFGG